VRREKWDSEIGVRAQFRIDFVVRRVRCFPELGSDPNFRIPLLATTESIALCAVSMPASGLKGIKKRPEGRFG
jgi:hypothetical protein